MFKVLLVLAAMSLAGCATSKKMTSENDPAHSVHASHSHQHSKDCGHKKIDHDGHADYLHDGHLHYLHGQHTDEHGINTSKRSTASELKLEAHHKEHAHKHGKDCGHKKVIHGNHFDYIHDGHYHHAHLDHVDEHGMVVAK